jgi:glycolate oxidase FAD binding subunit
VADLIQPGDAAEAAEAVAALAAGRRPCEILGHGTRRRLGRPAAAETRLDLSRLSGVVVYEPDELVLTVKAATPLALVRELLASERQHLAFEPPDYGPLWGAAAGLGTVGGMIGVGHGGPRRPFAGAPRDHLLGFKGVNGRGEPFAAGGRVVKNVTGFDLCKLVTGAYGTMAVLTELTLKVLPAPQASATLVFRGLADAPALALLRQAAGGPIPLAGAAHLPAEIAAGLAPLAPLGGQAATLVRLEGMAAVLPLAIERLSAASAPLGGPCEVLDGAPSVELWTALGGAAPFAGAGGAVWRVSVPATAAAAMGAELRAAGLRLYYDWAGRLLWAEGPPGAELGGGDIVREALARLAPDGHAALIRGDEGLRGRIAPLQPQSPGAAALSARIKAQFDPLGLFNPGRMEGAL